MKKKLLFCLSFALIAVGGSALKAENANAVSPADNIIVPTTDMKIRSSFNGLPYEIDMKDNKNRYLPDTYSTNLQKLPDTDIDFRYTSGNQSLLDEIKNFDVQSTLVFYTTDPATNDRVMYTYLTNDPNATIRFKYLYNYSWYGTLDITSGYRLIMITQKIFHSSNQQSITADISGMNGPRTDVTFASEIGKGQESEVLIYDGNIEYPTGYAGQPISDKLPVSSIPIDYWVNFTYSNTPQQLQAKYLNKETDPVSSAPDPEFVWWKLSTGGTHVSDDYPDYELVCEYYGRPSVTFVTQTHCPNLQIDKSKEYYLSASINKSYEDILSDSNYDITVKQTFYKIDFSKSSVGSTEQCTGGAMHDYMSIYCVAPAEFDVINCFQADFPWINIPDCNETFGILFQHLLFGGVSFPQWNHTPQCTNLNVLDNWLGLPESYTACAQFPSEVRNIITPFVAFLLGLVTFGFLQRRGIGDIN